MPLTNQTAIVTGASRGIGAAIVQTLAERGVTVIASGPAADPPDALVAELQARELNVHGRIADVTDPGQVQDLADSTRRELAESTCWSTTPGSGR